MPPNHLVLCHPLHLLPSIFPSIRVFSSRLVLCIRGPKYWSFSFSISPSNEYSGLISFRIDCFDLLALQGILKSLLQHHSSKVSILWCVGLSLGFLSCSIDLYFCFCASTMMSWWFQLCWMIWSQEHWSLLLHFSFSRLRWLFWVFCVSIQIVKFFVLILWKMALVVR